MAGSAESSASPSGVAAAAGPALGGWLVDALPGTTAVLVCAGAITVVTLLATCHPVLRRFPRTLEPEPEFADRKGNPDG